MIAVIIFIIVLVLLCKATKRLAKEMTEDYNFMMSQAEPRDKEKSEKKRSWYFKY